MSLLLYVIVKGRGRKLATDLVHQLMCEILAICPPPPAFGFWCASWAIVQGVSYDTVGQLSNTLATGNLVEDTGDRSCEVVVDTPATDCQLFGNTPGELVGDTPVTLAIWGHINNPPGEIVGNTLTTNQMS